MIIAPSEILVNHEQFNNATKIARIDFHMANMYLKD